MMIRSLLSLVLVACMHGSASAQVTAPDTADIRMPRTDGDFVLAPNPAGDHVRILPTLQQARLYVIVYDERNNNRLTAELLGPTRIDLSALPEGAYMVTTVDGRGTPLAAKRLLVRR